MYGWAIALFLIAMVVIAVSTGVGEVLSGSVAQVLFVSVIVIGLIAMIARKSRDDDAMSA